MKPTKDMYMDRVRSNEKFCVDAVEYLKWSRKILALAFSKTWDHFTDFKRFSVSLTPVEILYFQEEMFCRNLFPGVLELK